MDNDQIMIKVVNFSTFIKIVQNSKIQVTHSLCELYDITDDNGMPNVKLLIGSLQWMRMILCRKNQQKILQSECRCVTIMSQRRPN